MRLEGGLRLSRQVYLQGGEPDLWITIDDEAGADLRIDDRAAQLGVGIVRFRLSEQHLPEGPHEISAAGETRRFSTVRSFGTTVPDGAGRLGHVLARHRSYLPAASVATPLDNQPTRGHVVICGAYVGGAASDLPPCPHPPVVLRGGFEDYQILGRRPGEISAATSPRKPRWLSTVDMKPVPCQFFEFTPPFRAQLIIYRGVADTKVRPAGAASQPPEGSGADHGLARVWAETILRTDEAGPLVPAALAEIWAAYVGAARLAAGEPVA
jgi:hypothetical protein